MCSTQCAQLPSIKAFTDPLTCPASGVKLPPGASKAAVAQARLATKEAISRLELNSLVALSKTTSGTTLAADAAAEDMRIRAAKLYLPGGGGGASLESEMKPLNHEQESINRDRQMLYYRMETGIHPGENLDDSIDNFAKPTVWARPPPPRAWPWHRHPSHGGAEK